MRNGERVVKDIEEQHAVNGNPENKLNFYLVFGAIILTTFAIGWYDKRGLKVTLEEYGNKWPFTHPEARLSCDGGSPLVIIDGDKYGLTRDAHRKGYPPIDVIWRENPEKPGTKVWLGDITAKAREYCRY